jgi:hypothetical protein
MCVLFAALFQLEPSSFAFRTFFRQKKITTKGASDSMTITTTFVTVLRRFKYLAEKVMYSNHYTVLIMNVLFFFLSFLLHRTFTSGYLCTIALILFIHVGFLEYLSFKQFKLIVKIESEVTIP